VNKRFFSNTKLLLWFALLAIVFGARSAQADSITISGTLNSDSAAVGGGDPVITDPNTINIGDPFSIVFSYNPATATQSGANFTLNDASLTLTFDSYSFTYSTASGNFLEFLTPGAFGPGTASFLFCSSSVNCSTTDFLNLYFAGTITDLSTLESQAGGLTGDAPASPSEFEFLRNFDDGSQTDLQGVLTAAGATPTPAVPEPSMFLFVGAGLAAMVAARRLKIHQQLSR
jgi:hypothetical protein